MFELISFKSIISNSWSNRDDSSPNSKNKPIIKIFEDAGLSIMKSFIWIASLFTCAAIAFLLYLKAMKFSAFEVACSWRGCLFLFRCVIEVQSFWRIISKLNTDVLQCIIDGVVPLKVKESSRTAQRTHWVNEGDTFTCIVDSTRSSSLYCKIGLLSYYRIPWLLRIGINFILITNLQKLWLSWWACILTPKPFEVDSTDVTSSWLSFEYTIQLPQIICSE
jgi:hypothetical protein